MGRPASMSNSKMCFKICFWIQVILFYTQEIQFMEYLKLSLSLSLSLTYTHTHTHTHP